MRMLVPVPFRIRFQTAPWRCLPTLFDATCLFRLVVHTSVSLCHFLTPSPSQPPSPPHEVGVSFQLGASSPWMGLGPRPYVPGRGGGSRPRLSGGGTVPFEDGPHGQTLLAILSFLHTCVWGASVLFLPFERYESKGGRTPSLFDGSHPVWWRKGEDRKEGTSTDPNGKETPFRSTEDKSVSHTPFPGPNRRPSASVRRTFRFRIRPCRGGKEETKGRWQGNTTQ